MNYVIITFKGNEYMIDEATHRKLINMPLAGLLVLPNGTSIRGETIAEIVPENKHVSKSKMEYQNLDNPFKDLKELPSPPMSTDRIKEKNIHRIESMIKGLENYINSDKYQGTNAPKKLLEKAKLKLEQAKKGELPLITNPAKLLNLY